MLKLGIFVSRGIIGGFVMGLGLEIISSSAKFLFPIGGIPPDIFPKR